MFVFAHVEVLKMILYYNGNFWCVYSCVPKKKANGKKIKDLVSQFNVVFTCTVRRIVAGDGAR